MKIVVDLPEWYLKGIQGIKLPHYVDELIMEGQPLSEVLDKISAEIKELTKAHCIQVMDREDIPLLALDIIEKYKGDSE